MVARQERDVKRFIRWEKKIILTGLCKIAIINYRLKIKAAQPQKNSCVNSLNFDIIIRSGLTDARLNPLKVIFLRS